MLTLDQVDASSRMPSGWLPPSVVTAEELADALVLFPEAIAKLETMPTTEAVQKFLERLGMLTKSARASAAETSVIIDAIVWALEDFPAICFSSEMLKKAARKFTFFPSVAELNELLSEERFKWQKKHDRLLKIIEIGEKTT